MPDSQFSKPSESSLGTDARISRRDFIGSTLLASGSVLLGNASPIDLIETKRRIHRLWRRGRIQLSNGNTFAVLQAGHTIRDQVFEPVPKNVIDTGETYDCVIVGGGISGLAAALFFQRQASIEMKCLTLENHPIFGGEAKQNEFLVDGQRLTAHQGSAIYQIQYPYSFLARFYESIGLKEPQLNYQKWAGPSRSFLFPGLLTKPQVCRPAATGSGLGHDFRPKAGDVAD